ncbi:MAG TPA: N-acetylmuramoyl-L-alanine amidase [Candidatus Sulfotelmatobacter sp.]|jgi:N-acetylmuramoyl-L-alanine amidase|nr:N-acetylmuramoyl-L-alanine amidase [Candidatus Sulfotelmatobacter sp.]
MRVFKSAGILFSLALLFFVAGCESPTEPPPQEWSLTNSVPLLKTNVPWQPIPTVAKTNAPMVRTNLPPPRPSKPPIIYAYTSLNNWTAEQKLSEPLLLTKSPLTTYSVSSRQGVLVLAIGSREATWNGVTFHLGFAPEFIDGQVAVHGLDLRKNFEPLLTDPPLAFPGTNRVIVIDPGHGGANAGTIAVNDHQLEKDLTLDWARRLKPLLETNGWTVYLTRTTDFDVSLSNRVAFAEARHADLFVSLHFNSAAPDKKENGLETYCLTPQGMPSTLTRGNPDFTPQWFPNNAFDEENFQLAMRLHAAVLRASGEDDRGVRRARFMGVLHGNRHPAILIEGGFLSNPAEAKKVEDAGFRQKLAEAVANALAEARVQSLKSAVTNAP